MLAGYPYGPGDTTGPTAFQSCKIIKAINLTRFQSIDEVCSTISMNYCVLNPTSLPSPPNFFLPQETKNVSNIIIIIMNNNNNNKMMIRAWKVPPCRFRQHRLCGPQCSLPQSGC